MKRYLYNFLAALILLITVSSIVTAQAQSDESTTATRTGTISGQAVSDSGQPMANVLVSVRAYGAGGQGRTTTTESDGTFQISSLDPVAYMVAASLPGYVQAPRDPDANPNAYYHVGDSIRLEMIKGGVITGTVTRSAGDPVVAVPVRAYLIRDSAGRPPRYGAPFREQTTDDRGVYRVYGLSMGTYVISAGGGNPSSYFVSAYGTDAPTYAPSSTRDTAAEVFVRAGEEIANVDIRYRGEPGHVVSGTANTNVVGDQPQGLSITLVSTFNGVSQPSYQSFQPAGRGFSVSGVADGDYDLIAQAYFPGGGEWVVSDPRRIRVKGADLTGIELTAKPLGSITGRVALEESKSPDCKGKRRPLFREMVVSSWHNEKNAAPDQPAFMWGLGVPVLPDQQGDFHLRNLAPGQYRFNVPLTAKYWYLKSISWPSPVIPAAKAPPASRPFDAARNWTTLKPGDRLSGMIITMAEGAASLRGQIDLAEGQRLPPKLFAYLAPAEREKADDVLRFFAALVSADGSFALNNLPPGRYWVVAQAASESDTNVLSKLRLPDEAEARAKLLHDAEAAKIETELKPCQNVTDYRLPLKPAGPGQ